MPQWMSGLGFRVQGCFGIWAEGVFRAFRTSRRKDLVEARVWGIGVRVIDLSYVMV